MTIKVFKTFELTDNDWEQVVSGFNFSFDRNTTKEHLENLYISNVLGYSYHAVCYEQDKVIGFTSIMPFQYLHNEHEFKAGLSCSSFVLKEYRSDAFIYKDMFNMLKEECVKNDYSVFLGVPNKNSHKYSIVFLDYENIDQLPYYVLPLRLFTVLKKHKNNFVDMISAFFIRLFCYVNRICSCIFNFKEKQPEYRLLLTDEFHKKRFSSLNYTYSEKKNIKFWYRIVNEDGIKAAYLMDFREKNKRTYKALCSAVLTIIKKEKPDIVMYVGTLKLKQAILFKIPAKRVPKQLNLTVNILNKKDKERFTSITNLKQWDFSLMNFDAR